MSTSLTSLTSRTPLIVIIARNNLHLTQKSVNSALRQTCAPSVWVVDNSSKDGTHNWLRSKGILNPRFYWWSYLKQRSLSFCWNDALTRAFNLGHTHVLVLNNDVQIRPDTFSSLYNWSITYNTHFTTAVSVNSELELRPDDEPTTSSPHPDFSCFMISKECWDRVGKFDASYYPAYCEDNDYHVRMHRAGIKAVSIDLPYLHYSAGTIKHADPAEVAEIKRGAQINREKFKNTYGCYPSDPEYAELFKSKSSERSRAQKAKQ